MTMQADCQTAGNERAAPDIMRVLQPQIEQLTLGERLALLESLAHSLRVELAAPARRKAGATVELTRGMVRPGNLAPAAEDSPPDPTSPGWAAFLTLAQESGPGRLRDAAAQHDRYLYGVELDEKDSC